MFGNLLKIGIDQVVRRCVAENEHDYILSFCHERACGGHFGVKHTARKILDWILLEKIV